MNSIPLIHTSQALPFIEFLEKNGCPTERLLNKAKLPLALLDRVDGYIAEQQLWKLLDVVAKSEGLTDFGLRVGKELNVVDLLGGMVSRLFQQPSLHSALDTFCQLVKEESSDAQFWLATSNNGKQHWFCRGGVSGIQVGAREAEQYTLVLMVEMIRVLTCSNWQPKIVHLQTTDKSVYQNCKLFDNSNVSFGKSVTAIEIPSYLSNQLGSKDAQIGGPTQMSSKNSDKQETPAKDFTGSLSQILELYFKDDTTDINTAAEIIGVSARTLQRKLAKEGVGFSQLVDKARFKNAVPLLKDKSNKLIDIAYDLGYSDPAHFSRAFKRWSGVSPRTYRQQFAA